MYQPWFSAAMQNILNPEYRNMNFLCQFIRRNTPRRRCRYPFRRCIPPRRSHHTDLPGFPNRRRSEASPPQGSAKACIAVSQRVSSPPAGRQIQAKKGGTTAKLIRPGRMSGNKKASLRFLWQMLQAISQSSTSRFSTRKNSLALFVTVITCPHLEHHNTQVLCEHFPSYIPDRRICHNLEDRLNISNKWASKAIKPPGYSSLTFKPLQPNILSPKRRSHT